MPIVGAIVELIPKRSEHQRPRGKFHRYISLNNNAINPVLFEKNHLITKLMILNTHSQVKVGVNATHNCLRQEGIWILQARSAMQSVLKSCFICAKYNSKSCPYSKMPDFPSHRVIFQIPFRNTDVDFAGNI